MTLRLSQALRLSNSPCIAFVGAGGKTSAIFQLARELAVTRKTVIVTATTHLHVDQVKYADSHWVVKNPVDLEKFQNNLGGVMLVTGPLDGDRTSGVNLDVLSRLREIQDHLPLPILIEADGSRQRPLKAPSQNEPVIPDFVDQVVVVAGLTGLGNPLTEQFVHRPEIFARLSGLKMGETITIEALSRALIHPFGGLKNIPQQADRISFLNQADTPDLTAQGKSLAKKILPSFNSVIIGSLEKTQVHAVYEPVAGIVLAGGGSSRFGRPKQVLDWHGKPFVRAAVETALLAGLSPVVVVTGAHPELVVAALVNLPVTIVHNPVWQDGQSTSIQAGLHFLQQAGSSTSYSKGEKFGKGWERCRCCHFPPCRPAAGDTDHPGRIVRRAFPDAIPDRCTLDRRAARQSGPFRPLHISGFDGA